MRFALDWFGSANPRCDIHTCKHGDINVVILDDGDVQGLNGDCVYHADVNWEFLEGRGGSPWLGSRLNSSCNRWNNLDLLGRITRDHIYRDRKLKSLEERIPGESMNGLGGDVRLEQNWVHKRRITQGLGIWSQKYRPSLWGSVENRLKWIHPFSNCQFFWINIVTNTSKLVGWYDSSA